jgi:preprotein translocase subunit SecG
MIAIIKMIHIIVSFILILVVLLQTGKRADLAGAFGGGGSQTAFGTRGAATFLSKMTTTAAVVFMVTSLGLAFLSKRSSHDESVLDQVPIQQEQPTQSLPAIPPPTVPESSSSETEKSAVEGQTESPSVSEEETAEEIPE